MKNRTMNITGAEVTIVSRQGVSQNFQSKKENLFCLAGSIRNNNRYMYKTMGIQSRKWNLKNEI